MEQGHLVPEPLLEGPDGLGGEGDLRHHDDDAFPLFHHRLDELEEHQGLPAARHPVEQGAPAAGRTVLVLLPQGAEHLSLGGRQGLFLPVLPGGLPPLGPAVHLILKELYGALLAQGFQHRWGSPRKVAQLLLRGFPNIHQRLVHVPLPGRQLSGKIQHGPGHFGSGVPALAGGGVHLARHAQLQQPGKLRVVFRKAQVFFQLLQRHRLPRPAQKVNHLPGGVAPLLPVIVLKVLGEHQTLPHAKLQPRREHGLHRFEQGAVAPVLHPQGQVQHGLGQHRASVQQGGDVLGALGPLFLPGYLEDHGHPSPVAGAEGHRHPHAGPQGRGQLLGHAVGEQLIEVIDSALYRHLGQQETHSSSSTSSCTGSGSMM